MERYHNYINELQEFLQQGAPLLGCRPEQLYDISSKEVCLGRFKSQVILLNIEKGDKYCGWSHEYSNKKDSRQDAARIALKELGNQYPHRPDSRASINVNIKTNSSSNSTNQTELKREMEWKEEYLHLLSSCNVTLLAPNVLHKSLTPNEKPIYDIREEKEVAADEDDDEEDGEANDCMKNSQNNEAPINLGKLGEKFAYEWLQKQLWVESALWLNQDEESNEPYDIVCHFQGHPDIGRKYIEVKTRWRNFKRTSVSSNQAARLSHNDSDYMLLVIGDFRRILNSESPLIRCLPNVLCKVIEIDPKLVGHIIGREGKKIKLIIDTSETKINIKDSKKETINTTTTTTTTPKPRIRQINPSGTATEFVRIEIMSINNSQIKLARKLILETKACFEMKVKNIKGKDLRKIINGRDSKLNIQNVRMNIIYQKNDPIVKINGSIRDILNTCVFLRNLEMKSI